ncbi:glycosyltransferase [Paenibacillus sp. RC67]|uniref:glycosyltransferase n=1 Tax=Paenibacillus sp. RC67 TaxID=3039392 RepID=UPI0032C23933
MKYSIVLLVQHAELAEACIARIEQYTGGAYEIIAINDGGGDIVTRVLERTKVHHVLTNHTRLGVAASYNQGAAIAAGERLVFIRDHIGVSEQWLFHLSDCLDNHPDAAMVGPMSNDVSGMQRLPIPCETMMQLDRTARAMILTQSGCSQKVTRLLSHLLLMRKEVLERLGGFDERFGLETYEDDDLCYRALQAGYSLYIAQDCFVRYTSPPSLFPEEPNWYSSQLTRNQAIAQEKWGLDVTEALMKWTYPVTVSLCMIVKNEEQTLDRCLSSVKGLVDEIIIVDTGSEDRTKEIAGRYTDRLFDFTWVHDFARARNYAFSQATQDYILWLDADDVVQPHDAEKLQRLLSAVQWDTDAVSMNYNIAFNEYGQVTVSSRRNRLVKREKRFQWIGPVHEYLNVYGNIVASDISITHDRLHKNSSRNLNIYETRLAAGEAFNARDLYYFANELADHEQWERAIEQYEQFLKHTDGWVEDKIRACGRMADSFHNLGNIQEAKSQALQSFVYGLPKAENCCRLGFYCLSEERYEEAVFWYKLAVDTPKPDMTNAIIDHDCWTWLPHLQLCVCYDRLGKKELANQHNEIAMKFIPNDSRVLANKRYFETVLS